MALRSFLIGIFFLLINVALGFVAVMIMINAGDIRFGPQGPTIRSLISLWPYGLVYLYQIAFCGYPFLFPAIALVTWFLLRNLLNKETVSDGKSRLMVAVWFSLSIALSPFLVAALLDFVGTLKYNGLDGSRGSKYELVASLLLLIESIFLILLMGLLARILVRRNHAIGANPMEGLS